MLDAKKLELITFYSVVHKYLASVQFSRHCTSFLAVSLSTKGNTAESFAARIPQVSRAFLKNVLGAGFNYCGGEERVKRERHRILRRTIRTSRCLAKETDDLPRFRAMVLFSNSRNKGFFSPVAKPLSSAESGASTRKIPRNVKREPVL